MTQCVFRGISPKIGTECFIADSADIIGNVELSDHASVWFQVVIRGDIEPIFIGRETNIQDLSMLHTSEEFPLHVGDGVTIGHSVTLHGCTVEDNCLIGMGSTVLDGAVIGKNSVVAAGSLVPPGKKYPEGKLIRGNPAVVVRDLSAQELLGYGNHYKSYLVSKNAYLENGSLQVIEN